MNITMAMVFEELKKHVRCELGDYYSPSQHVSLPYYSAVYSPSLCPEDACYIRSVDEVSTPPGIPAKQVIFVAPECAGKLPCAIRVLQDCSTAELKALIVKAILVYERWADGLVELSTHGAGIEEMMDFAHGLFGNPITIADQDYRVFALTKDDALDDKFWVDISSTEKGFSAAQSMSEDEAARFDCYLRDLAQHKILRYAQTHEGRPMASCLVEGDYNRVIGVNLIYKNRPITEADIDCLQFFAKTIGAKLQAVDHSWRDSAGSYTALLQDVLRGNLATAGEFKERLSASWISVKPFFTVFKITARRGLLAYNQLCQIEDELERLLPEGKGVIFERSLYLFVNHEEDLGASVESMLEAYADENQLQIAKSESRGEDYSLRELVEQTEIAERIGRRLWPNEVIISFHDCRRYLLIDECSRRDEWRRFQHPCLELLRAYDEHSDKPLLSTLRCLVANCGSRTNTALKLGIQRNTLQYRLSKIEEITGVKINDPDEFGQIVFSMMLEEYCAVDGNGNPAPVTFLD